MDALEQKTVVLVEDDEGVLALLGEVLENCGYAVRAFHNPIDALAGLGSATPDLIILDWYLPFMTGRDFVARLEVMGLPTPVVVLTGDVNLRKSRGITEVLVKPVGLDVLTERVAALTRAGGLTVPSSPWLHA